MPGAERTCIWYEGIKGYAIRKDGPGARIFYHTWCSIITYLRNTWDEHSAKAARLKRCMGARPVRAQPLCNHNDECISEVLFSARAFPKLLHFFHQFLLFSVVMVNSTRCPPARLSFAILLLAFVMRVLSQAPMESELVENNNTTDHLLISRALAPGTCTASIPCVDGSCCNSA